jgi:hypothetical protein
MEKAARGQLIRERFKQKVGKAAYVPSGRKSRKAESVKESRVTLESFGLALSHRWGRTEWLERPTAKPSPEMGKRNRQGAAALSKIAEKWEQRPHVPTYAAFSASLSRRRIKSATVQT